MVLSKRLYTPRSFDLGIEMDIYVCELDVSALLAAIYVIQPAWARKICSHHCKCLLWAKVHVSTLSNIFIRTPLR